MTALHLIEFAEKELFNISVEIDGIAQVLGGKAGLSGKALRGEEIFQPVPRQGFDLEIALADQSFQESVYKAHGDVESLGKLPLARIAVPGKFAHQAKHVKVLFVHLKRRKAHGARYKAKAFAGIVSKACQIFCRLLRAFNH